MASFSNITRRLSQIAVRPIASGRISALATTDRINSIKPRTTTLPENQTNQCLRTFSSNNDQSSSDKQWSQWQQSLLKNADAPIIKKRGGKKTQRKKEVAQSLSSQERLLDGAGPGQFPPLRYSDDETERLLQIAYENIPERGGKRGTRRKKRMKNKFHQIRKARSIKKAEKIAHHFDKMDKRSLQVEGIRKMKELAKEVRVDDQEYQMSILRKWAEINGLEIGGKKSEIVEGGDGEVPAVEK